MSNGYPTNIPEAPKNIKSAKACEKFIFSSISLQTENWSHEPRSRHDSTLTSAAARHEVQSHEYAEAWPGDVVLSVCRWTMETCCQPSIVTQLWRDGHSRTLSWTFILIFYFEEIFLFIFGNNAASGVGWTRGKFRWHNKKLDIYTNVQYASCRVLPE